MGGCYLKVYRTTKMASGMDDFLYEDNLDAFLAITDADMFEDDKDTDMFENNKDMESTIVTCIKKLPSRENCSFKCQFCPKVYLSKAGLSRHEKATHQLHTTFDSVNHSDSGDLKSSLELTDFNLMYQKIARKLSTDECYPKSVIEEFKNCSASLADLTPHYYCHDLFLTLVYTFSAFLFLV